MSESASPSSVDGLGRRRYLGLGLASITLGGAGWLTRWLGAPPATGENSFRRRSVWRDTLPTPEWDPANHLILHHDSFDQDPSFATQWHRETIQGSAHDVSTGYGQVMIQNNGDGSAEEMFVTPVDIVAPWVAVATVVSERSTSAHVAVGLSKRNGDYILGSLGPEETAITARFGGQDVTLPGETMVPDRPFEQLVILMGDRFAYLVRESGQQWEYHGHIAWSSRRSGPDLYERTEWASWDPSVWVETDHDDSISIDDVRVCHGLQFGVRDPTVVTYPDGSPFVRDGELYLTATCGSIDHRGYQVVLGLDVETYDVTMHAALWAESVPGHISNYVASHIMYDPDRDEFRQCWSGFGNGPHEPYWNQKCWVSRTEIDVLTGPHLIPCERMGLPVGWSGRQHDPFVIRDAGTGTWRCLHNSDSIHRVTISETADDTWTDGWTPVASYRDVAHQIEGGKLARINGEIILSYADEGSRNEMVTAAYPDPSADRRWIEIDRPTGDVAPHPSIVSVPSEAGQKCLLITMDGETVYGLGEPSHGALIIYEASEETAP